VGVGTGKELIHLANKFPRWRFTTVEPSSAMLDVCRHQAEEAGISSRCDFHEGYLDSLPAGKTHDGATCFLVSQFILEREARSAFFQQIASRLKPGGILASSDLSGEIGTESFEALFRVWFNVMSTADASPEWINKMKAAYEKDVAILPTAAVASIIKAGGFETPVEFFQAGFIHAWFAKCASDNSL
jgi:tRNA (cmo5U34)-methyltransferase